MPPPPPIDGADIRIPPPDDMDGCDIAAPELIPPMCIGGAEDRGSILGLGLSLRTGGAICAGGVGIGRGGAAAGVEAGAGVG